MPNCETLVSNFNIEPHDIQRREELYYLIEGYVLDPRRAERVADPVEKALFGHLAPELLEGGKLKETMEWVYAFRRQRGSYFPRGLDLRTMEFSLDKQFRKLFPEQYPRFATGRHFWEGNNVFGQIDPDELVWDMQQSLRSNIPQSYEVFKILSHIFQDRWNHKPTVVDTGTSLGLGIRKWKQHNFHPSAPITVLQAPSRGMPISPELPVDEAAQDRVNQIVNETPVIGAAVGYDILPVNPENTDLVKLVFSSTFPMSRSMYDRDAVAEFNALVGSYRMEVALEKILSQPGIEDLIAPEVAATSRAMLENLDDSKIIRNRNIDATDAESLTQLTEFLPNGKADIFTFSGVIIQFAPEKLANIFNNFLPYCNEGALIFVNEWANVNPSQPGGLEMIREDWWHKRAHFKTFIIDPFNLDQPPVEFCRYLSRQCEQMYLSPTGRRLLLGGF